MLMVNYLQRFLSKWRFVILILLIISTIVITVSFQINRWLPNYILSFSDLIAQQSHTKISYSATYYRFPNYLIFQDIKILSAEGKPMLQASRVVIGLSFPLFSSAAYLNSMVIDDMTVNFPTLKDYWAKRGKQICEWIKTIPKENMHLLVPNGRIQLKNKPQDEAIDFQIDLHLNQDQISAHGFWDNKDKFNYEILGSIRDSGFDLDKLTLKDQSSSANLWGSWHNDNIDWKGFIFYDKFYILDIEGHLKMQKENIVLKQLSFTIDGDAVGASGQCSKQKFFQCDADLAYWRGGPSVNTQGIFKNINMHLHAQNTPQGLVLRGQADLYSLFNPSSPIPLQKAHLDFENLTYQIINGNFLKLRIKQAQSILSIQGNERKLLLENILASFNFSQPYKKFITLSGKIFAGHFYSRIFFDTTSFPWQIKSQNTFEGLHIYQGLLSGDFTFQSAQDLELSGILALHHGSFNNTHFLDWLAKILQMPSLNQASGVDLSCRFRIDKGSKILDDIKLNTDDINLSGFYHLDADDLVSSQASARFSKKLLSESPIGRKIIGLVHGAWTLPFEFSLSGNAYRMNFQWNNSPLKDKVRQHMFLFFERMIDERMNAHPYYKVTIPNESVSPG